MSSVAKILKSFKFDSQISSRFKQLAKLGGYTVTGSLEKFMGDCVNEGKLVFPELGVEGFEAEAGVLVDWLQKGKRFYRGEGGEEVNIPGRLVCLLSRVHDTELRLAMEKVLKGSVSASG